MQRPESEAKATEEQADDSNSLEFPVGNLYELEGRVFTESWSIPYKKEESLGKCLLAATRLAQEGRSGAQTKLIMTHFIIEDGRLLLPDAWVRLIDCSD